MEKVRLDKLMCENGLAKSRERAKALISAGQVSVNGAPAMKAGVLVPSDAAVEVTGGDIPYVSRGGLKLEGAMNAFRISFEGLTCMDVGASTGGFTDCMLQNGAAKVYALDVGSGQLADHLREDVRVVNMERTNIRDLSRDMIEDRIGFFSVDVSFISLSFVFPAMHDVCSPGAQGACLVKPQFEAGREKVGKKGVVKDARTHRDVIMNVIGNAIENGWSARGIAHSPIKGPEGNIEFLLLVQREQDADAARAATTIDEASVRAVVEAAHARLQVR